MTSSPVVEIKQAPRYRVIQIAGHKRERCLAISFEGILGYLKDITLCLRYGIFEGFKALRSHCPDLQIVIFTFMNR